MKKEDEIILKANLEDRPIHAKAIRALFKHPNFPRMMCLNGSIVENPIYDYLEESTIDRIRLDYGPNGSKNFRIMPLDLFLIKGFDKKKQPMLLCYWSGKPKSGWKSFLILFRDSNKEKNVPDRIKKHEKDIETFLQRRPKTVTVTKLPDTKYLVSFKVDQGYKELVAYIFTFCYVNISGNNSDIARKEFEFPVGDYTRKFKWYHPEEMEEDKRMIEVDGDVVRYIHNIFETMLTDVPISIANPIKIPRLETWDLFICHASEDKPWVKKLANTLRGRGWGVWYDEFELTLGDSLRRRIDHGLTKSRFGVVVLSKSFFTKEFPNRELDGLAAREINGKKVILPIWHSVSRQDVERYSPTLADRLAVSTEHGIDKVVDEIERALVGPDSPAKILQYRELSNYDGQIKMGIRLLRDHRPMVRASVALDLGFRGRNLPIDYRKRIGEQLIPLLYDREPEVRGNGAWAIGEILKELPSKSKEIVKIPLEFLLNDDEECREVDENHTLHRSRVANNARNALIKLGHIEPMEE